MFPRVQTPGWRPIALPFGVNLSTRKKRTGSQMISRITASRFLLAASVMALAACADAPNPVQPPSTASLARGAGQDRLAALFT